MGMSNHLKMEEQKATEGLLALGYSQRKIAAELGVHRATVKRYADSNCTLNPGTVAKSLFRVLRR